MASDAAHSEPAIFPMVRARLLVPDAAIGREGDKRLTVGSHHAGICALAYLPAMPACVPSALSLIDQAEDWRRGELDVQRTFPLESHRLRPRGPERILLCVQEG